MEIIEGIIIGGLICLFSFIGFMISVVNHLDKISREQEKITQFIPYDYLKKSINQEAKENVRI